MDSESTGGRASGSPPVGEAENVSRTFGGTRALHGVSLAVAAGACHGLVGRNGAGKSTLVSLMTGLDRPDSGVIRLGGEAAPGLADRTAWQSRVACVYQRSMVVPTLTVAENIFLNRPTGARESAFVNWRRIRFEARRTLREWGFELDVDREAGTLTVEQRQVVEIARSLSIGARFLILDEPTATLEKAAVERLFQRVRRLREGGVGVLYISHHLEEIYEVCDRVSVLRDGELVLAGVPVADVSRENLVAAMVGAAAPRRATTVEAAPARDVAGGPRLQISHLAVRSASGSVEDVTFEVRAGECVGLVGLDGSGTATVADAVVGMVRPDAGVVSVRGRPVRPGRVGAVLDQGVGYVPQDRHASGFAPQLGLDENLTLALLDRLSRWGIVRFAARTRVAAEQVDKLQIVASSLRQPVASLSGGNQQKVTVGRAFARNPSVLVVVSPTVGVDVAAKEALLDALENARDRGVAVLLVSDDFEDLRVCTRLLVMVRGRVTQEFDRPPWDREALIAAVEGLDGAILAGGRATDG